MPEYSIGDTVIERSTGRIGNVVGIKDENIDIQLKYGYIVHDVPIDDIRHRSELIPLDAGWEK